MSDLISHVKELYVAFSRGDVATIVANTADDVIWESEGPPELLSAGIRHSPKGVAEFFSDLAVQAVDHHLEMTDFFSNEEGVAVFGRYQGTAKPTGIRIDIPMAHYFKFRDGKIVRFVQVSNTAASAEALRGRAASATP